jgi:hypothetical protein
VGFEKSEYETPNHEDLETPASSVSASQTSDAGGVGPARMSAAWKALGHTRRRYPVEVASHVRKGNSQLAA